MYRLTIRHIHRLVNNAMKQPPRLLSRTTATASNSINLKLISQFLFGLSAIVLVAEVVRPGVLIHPVVWPKTPRQRIGTLQLDNEVVSVVLPLQDDAVAVKSDPVKILFWTQYFSADFEPGDRHNHFGEVHEELDKCPIKNCITFTHDKAQINDSAAVFFHIRDFFPQADRPTVRVPGQYYVFYLLESPLNTHMDLNSMEGFFNLTFTYRRDSDIPASYYHRRFGVNTWTEGDGEFEKLWKGKTDFSAIFMSFCGGQSGRNGYLDELGKAMSLDIYGSCGPGVKKCEAMNKTDWHCDEMLSTYKFYLAFENSICRDYMTEKVYRALNHGTIPVVYGGANYKDFLPPHSFIDILDFKNPAELAARLTFLADNPAEYAKYFKWRYDPRLTVLPKRFRPESSWCRLCEMLRHKERPQRIVRNLSKWWYEDAHCSFPSTTPDGKWAANPVVKFD